MDGRHAGVRRRPLSHGHSRRPAVDRERTRAIGFTAIWAALLIYAGEGLRLSRRQRRVLKMEA